jgi:hypothetical protein
MILRNVIFQPKPVEKLFLVLNLTHHRAALRINISIESGGWLSIKHIQRQEINIWWPEFFTDIDRF